MMLCGLWGERTTDKVKLLRQFLVIMAVSFIGEILHAVLPLPIPASIYGLVLMLALLMTGALKLDAVEDAGKFMIEIMPVMFIPAGVGLMESWGELKAGHNFPNLPLIFQSTLPRGERRLRSSAPSSLWLCPDA